MSKYFEVLERLDRGKGEAAVATRPVERVVEAPREEPPLAARASRVSTATPEAAPSAPPEAPRPPAEIAVEAVRSEAARPAPKAPRLIQTLRGQVAERVDGWRARRVAIPQKGIDTLFNNLEALTLGRRPLTLVLAGASANDSVAGLAIGLAAYAQERGQRALVAELRETPEGPVIVERRVRPAAVTTVGADERLPVDLHGGSSGEVLGRWRERTSPGAEIMFVIGPPLVESVDSALLASHCDGLVIVAVQEETSRASLLAAAERARLTSTPTLGVVVDRGRNYTPPWLRRLIGR